MDWLLGTKYNIWVIHTNEEMKLFLWNNWKLLIPSINELVNISSEQTFIRTFQSYEYENKWLGFGRMKWSPENNKKWTTKYLNEDTKSKTVNFFSTQIWSPDWNEYVKTNKSPKLYINLYHNLNPKYSKEGILIAIQKKIAIENQEIITMNVNSIRNQIKNSKISKIERRWRSAKGYVNSIENMNPQELEKLIKEGYA